MPTEQSQLPSHLRHRCWWEIEVEFPLPTRTGAPRHISLAERNSAFWNPFYQWNRQYYKMNKSHYWYFVHDMLAGQCKRQIREDETTMKEENVTHLGIVDYFLIIPAIFKIAYYYASNPLAKFISAVFAVPVAFAINKITYIVLSIVSPVISYSYHWHQWKIKKERQRLIDTVDNMRVIPLKTEDELYPSHSCDTVCHQPQYQLFEPDEKPTINWHQQREKTLGSLIKKYNIANRPVFPSNNRRNPELPTDLPQWILLPLHKKVWHEMGFAVWPTDASDPPPIWGLYKYDFWIAKKYQHENNDFGDACFGIFELPIMRHHAFSPSALFIPSSAQPEGLFTALQQLNAFCIEELTETAHQTIKQNLEKPIEDIITEIITHNPMQEKPMSSKDIMSQLKIEMLPSSPLLPEEHEEAKSEKVNPAAIKEDLFRNLKLYKYIFQIPWPEGERADQYICGLTQLLLWHPVSNSMCRSPIPHCFERAAIQEEQQRSQMENSQMPFSFCPCCCNTAPMEYVFTPAIDLQEEIQRWLRNVKLYLEDLGSQIAMPVNTATAKLHAANSPPVTSYAAKTEMEKKRLELIQNIEHFLLHGNDAVFLHEKFLKMTHLRLKRIKKHLQQHDISDASKAFFDVSANDCDEPNHGCLTM